MGILDAELDDVLTIPQYFKGKTVFITGGSGFMGKVLVEKLLYSCTDLERIYLLLRCKKEVKPEDRLAALYSSPCFDRLRKELPAVFAAKVSVIPGDVMETDLGISEENRALLINNVNIVFHAAASVRFDDTLKFAVKLNLGGTIEVLKLAKEIKNLSSMVHVSTSYSNTNQNPVEEVMYPPHANWRDVLTICDEVDDHTLRVLTPKMLGCLPNTYTFTKQLAEHVVYENKGQLPVVIFRPSIVISSVEEPVKGWIENFNGPVGMLVASGKGIMRSLYTDPDLMADFMPVDISIKAIIAAAWRRGIKQLEPIHDVPIYNCCSGNLHQITTGEILELGIEINSEIPLDDILWKVGGSLTTSPTLHYMKVIFLHLLPAILVDTILRITGRKPMLVKLQRRIFTANLALAYYITQQWTFKNENLIALRSSIKEVDREQFFFMIERVDQREYFKNATLGAKKYLLKEKEENLPKALAHQKRMWVLDKLVSCTFYGCLIWWFINLSSVHNFAHSVAEHLM